MNDLKQHAIKLREEQRLAKQLTDEQARERSRKIEADAAKIRGRR